MYEPFPVVTQSRIAYWDTPFDYSDKAIPAELRFEMIGKNSGNLVHWHALKQSIPMNSFSEFTSEKLKSHDIVITPVFIYITQSEGLSFASHVLDSMADKPVVPISVG